MAWTYVASTKGYSLAAVSTYDSDDTLNLAIGDVLCIYVGWGGATTTVAVATDAAADDFTMQTVNQYSTRNGGCIGNVVVGTADATANIRVTLGAERGTLSFVVYQFRPDAGDEVTLVAGPGSANAGSGNAPQSANISPDGTDLLCYAGAYNAAGVQQTSEQIGDEAADGSLDSNRLTGWYTIYDSSQTDIHAQCTFGDNDSWTCDIIALESAAGGGPTPTYSGRGIGRGIARGIWR